MVINGMTLLKASPIRGMAKRKMKLHGVSYGLGEAGYDIRIKQQIVFTQSVSGKLIIEVNDAAGKAIDTHRGRFTLASAIEEFQMPDNLVGVVHDKSTWARKGLSVFNTIVEPGWNGFLTLELVYHGYADLIIPAGAGIAQVIFSQISNPSSYEGKYQNQADEPVEAILQT
jgi:dCTP deaminase